MKLSKRNVTRMQQNQIIIIQLISKIIIMIIIILHTQSLIQISLDYYWVVLASYIIIFIRSVHFNYVIRNENFRKSIKTNKHMKPQKKI